MTDSLRKRLAEPRLLLTPGVYDGFSALLAAQAGFEALYLSGASLAYARFGLPDIGLVGLDEVAATIAAIRDRVPTPLIVDGDTGFGNALNVQRTVRSFARAGANAVQLEDQTFPKRCGHLDEKRVVPVGEMVGKIKAACDARPSPDVLIVGRTDAAAVEGLNAALDRAEAYRDAGADILFVEALRSEDDMRLAVSRLAGRAPLLANMVEGGKTPLKSAAELQAIGFRIAIFPGGLARAVAKTMQDYFASLKAHGTTAPFRDRMLDFQGLNALIGTADFLARGKTYE